MDQTLQGPTGGALAEPVVEEPTDEELLEINDGAYCPCADEVNGEDDSSWQYTSDYIRWLDENGTPQEQGAYAAKGLRAVFEAGRRFGHQPAPPVEGEVAELVAALRTMPLGMDAVDPTRDSVILTRAADLLERLASPACLVLKPSPELTEAFKDLPPGRIELLPEDAQVIEPTEHTILVPARTPVPVSERSPGPGDCDGDGRCWWLAPETAQKCAVWCFGPKYPPSMFGATHWLPATTLTLPAGEVEK